MLRSSAGLTKMETEDIGLSSRSEKSSNIGIREYFERLRGIRFLIFDSKRVFRSDVSGYKGFSGFTALDFLYFIS